MSTSVSSQAPRSGVAGLPTIRVFNTLTKTKEPFEPVAPPRVGIYLCGPTVYKPSHIGHMVGPVIFDTIKRFLVYCGYQVTLVINITDIDDKLIQEAAARGIDVAQLAEEMTADYLANLRAMGVDTVDQFPRATDNIDEIIAFTAALIDKGYAYPADGGDVYFDVARDPEYGKLSNRTLDSMQGEGGEMAGRKRSPADFALWKGAKPGEPSWPSPWGAGRPGWHIECSAMSRRYLGETFDIHGGGLDLVFPHHENEVAQSECCHGKPQAKYWLHNGLMQAADEIGKVGGRRTREATSLGEPALDAAQDRSAQEAGKMGKSKGASAFSTLLTRFAPETIRFFLLSTQYRRPIYYSEEHLRELGRSLDTFYRFFKRFERLSGTSFYDLPAPGLRRDGDFDPTGDETLAAVARHRRAFLEQMDDDFNTGGGIGDLFELVRVLNRYIDQEKLESQSQRPAEKLAVLHRGALVLRELSSLLGLFRQPTQAPPGEAATLVEPLVSLLVRLRGEARKTRQFATADQIRDGLAALGVALEDRADGTEWQTAAAGPELQWALLDLAVKLRGAARQAKQFAAADQIRDTLASLGVVLEDRPDGTGWTLNG